jgi:hypothetical protein
MVVMWLVLIVFLVEKILSESRRLDREEEEADVVLQRSFDQLREARKVVSEAEGRIRESSSRISRIRKQRRVLVTKGAMMVNRGIENLDELESVEEREEEERRVAAASRSAFGALTSSSDAPAEHDWTAVEIQSFLGELGNVAPASVS